MKESLISLITWPNGRESVRLVEALSDLESHIANLQALGGGNAPSAATSEVTKLRQENRSLRERNTNALERLDSLIEQLETIADAEQPESQSQQQAAA